MDWFNPFEGSEGGGGGSGTDNYNELINKPSINNVVLSGNKTEDDLGLQKKINSSNKISSDNVNDSGAQNLFTNAAEKQTWNAKQDAIQNLQDIQNGAALGATSLQPSDVKSTYSSSGTDPVNGKAVAAAIGTLDVAAVGGSGSFISGISETNGKISATAGTVDSTPTESSTGLVTSAGIYTDQARQDALEAQDRAALIEVVDNGAKNLLKNELGSGTKSGLAYTTGTDGSIVITAGTATRGNADFVIPFTPKESGQYVLQGCPSGGSGTTYKGQIVLYPSMSNVVEIFDNTSATATLTGGTEYAYRFRVYNGKAISDSTIYPMVCSKAAWDISHAYVPYGKTNAELTAEMNVVANAGAKNYAPIETGANTTGNKWVVGAGSGNAEQINLIAGDYIFTAVSSSAGSGQCQIKLTYSDGTTALTTTFSFGSTMTLTFTASKDVVGYGVYSNAAPVTFEKMMIRPAAITDPTFQPFARSNPALTAEMDYVVNAGAKNLASKNSGSGTNSTAIPKTPITLPVGDYICSFSASSYSGNAAFELWNASNSQQYVKELTVAGSNSFKFTVTGNMSVVKYSLYVNNATISDFMIRPAAITDPIFQPYARTNRELTVLTDEDRDALVELVDGGAKNGFIITGKSGVIAQVTYTVDKIAGTINASGSPSSTSVYRAGYVVCQAGKKYIVSGCPAGGDIANGYSIRVVNTTGNTIVWETGSSSEFEYEGTVYIDIFVRAGASVSGVFKPMICTKAAWDISNAFAPYARTNRDLTVLTDEDRAELILNRTSGYLRTKNLLDLTRVKALNPTATWSDNVMSLNGVDWAFNNDGSITVDGTANSNGSYPILMNWKTLQTGSYMMSGGNPTVKFTAYSIGSDKGNGFQLAIDNATTQPISFIGNVSADTVVNNIKISPMLCTLDDYQVSSIFEPYSPSNFELMLMILALQSGGNRALTMQPTESTEPEEQEER